MSIFPDGLGWMATAIFVLSYFSRDATKLRLVQAAAALFWIFYGVLIHARPVIVANVIVTSVAIFSASRLMRRKTGAA